MARAIYTGELVLNHLPAELLGQADPDQPTFVNCRAYRFLVWTGVKSGDAPVQYAVYGGDPNGWLWTRTGMITAGARQWFRVTIEMPYRTDWLRVVVSGTPQTLRSKIVGVKG